MHACECDVLYIYVNWSSNQDPMKLHDGKNRVFFCILAEIPKVKYWENTKTAVIIQRSARKYQ